LPLALPGKSTAVPVPLLPGTIVPLTPLGKSTVAPAAPDEPAAPPARLRSAGKQA
jgi:hypothetical protein